MVVCGVVNISANVNPDGSIVALDSDSNGSRVTLVGNVTLGSGPTPCTSLGDILGWVFLAGFIFFMIYKSVTERRVKRVAQS
jgi:apolipoprotein N-acyltransferase